MSRSSLPGWEEWTTSGAWASADNRTLPLSPGLLGEVLWLIQDPEVDANRLLRFISRDRSMAARVLRLANAAAFAPMSEVTSINLAVFRLGTDAVRRAMLAVCFASWARPLGAHADELRDQVSHGVVVATIARHVATSTGADPDEAFAQGLLHDVGKLFLLRLQADYARIGGVLPPADELERVRIERHAEVGGLAMQLWGLPLVLREAIRWHHEPLAAPTYPRAAALINVANRLSHRYQSEDEQRLDMAADPILTGLNLNDAWLARTDAQSSQFLESADRLALAV